MRIGFDAKRAFFNNTGLGNYSRNTIKQLLSFYPENEYLLYTPKKNFKINFDYGKAKCIYPKTFTGQVFSSWWRSFLINSQLDTDKLDIYHGLSNEIPFGSENLKLKRVVSIHDLIFMRYPDLYKTFDRKMYYKKFLYASQKADKVIAVSEQTKNDIMEFFKIPKEKIEVIYQSCNPLFFKEPDLNYINNIKEKYKLPDSFILYVGTIEERKNLLSLIKALVLNNIDIPLVAIGRKTDYFEKIAEFLGKHNLVDSNNFIFFNNLPNEDLPAFYRLATVFVYPSIFEGFGIPILESLASGTPVITSKGSCFAEAGGSESLYVTHDSVDEIAESLKKVLQNSDLANKMIESGKLHAKNFTESKVAENINNLYKSLLK